MDNALKLLSVNLDNVNLNLVWMLQTGAQVVFRIVLTAILVVILFVINVKMDSMLQVIKKNV